MKLDNLQLQYKMIYWQHISLIDFWEYYSED